MNDTPRTHSAAGMPSNDFEGAANSLFDLAQELERELTASQARCAELELQLESLKIENAFLSVKNEGADAIFQAVTKTTAALAKLGEGK